jgi:UDP-N-acetylglucosamine 2-epimerase (non-hydrolysing)
MGHMKTVCLVAGARPNFIKIAPLYRALQAQGFAVVLVHTGQHYDTNMSDVFFKELAIPDPDVHLGVGSGDRITQSRKIVQALVPLLQDRKPQAMIVVGDVTSTAASAMASVVAGVPLVHVEAGLRSFNWRMPEELNRMIADHHSDILFVSDPAGMKHLEAECIPAEKIHYVGNIMIDSLRAAEPVAESSDILDRLGLKTREYGVLTLHRPETVDHPEILRTVWGVLKNVSGRLPLVFPVHPRTKSRLVEFGEIPSSIHCVEPVGYLDMIKLVKNATVVLTDSGGLQEEATALSVPCLTLRDETERPSTVEYGTSEVVGRDPERIAAAFDRVMQGGWRKGTLPPLWDGKTAERIAEILKNVL